MKLVLAILFFMFLPAIIAFGYQSIMKLRGIKVNEGNSPVFALFWLCMVTIPIGAIALIIIGIRSFMN